MYVSALYVQAYVAFSQEVIARMADWPFYCTDCVNARDANASLYAPYLHDALYLYAIALSNAINATGRIDPADYRNGTFMAPLSAGSFQGQSGDVFIDNNGARRTIYQLMAYPNNITAPNTADMVPYAQFVAVSGLVVMDRL